MLFWRCLAGCLLTSSCFDILSMSVSHCCACVCRAIAMRLASGGSSLYVLASGGSSLKETSWAISASVLTVKDPVRLITMGMISMSSVHAPCLLMALLRGE